MKKWLAIAFICTLILISAGSVIYSASFEHMASQNGCVFTFGGSSQCITDIVGSILLTQNALPTVLTLLFLFLLLVVATAITHSLFHPNSFSKYRLLESFSSPYCQQLKRWSSLTEHSPTTL